MLQSASVASSAPRCCTVLVALLMLGACDDGEPSTQDSCRAGAVRACTGESGCAGRRTCRGTPARWGECECGDAAQSPAPGPDAGTRQPLGAGCTRDGDCPAGAFCLDRNSDALFGGAPPDGVCVADCSEDEAACARFADAVCVAVAAAEGGSAAASALCFERCSLGREEQPKCAGGAHVACAPIEDSSGAGAFCRPLCANDDECGARECDPAYGVCVASAGDDRSFGLRCDPELDPDADAGADASGAASCVGPCVQLNAAPSLCSRRCVFGEAGECAPASGGLRRGGCVFASEGGAIGDLGYCGELCDCNDDCIEPSFVCDAFEDESLEAAFGRLGVCTDPELVLTRALACTP